MSNQKEIRARISSTISTQQITKAMKLVSATKLRKASDAIVRMRPYSLKLQGIMSNLQESADDEKLAGYFHQRELQKVTLVVVTSDRGLCGAFNANVVKRTRALLENDYSSLVKNNKVELLCIGKKGAESLKRLGYSVNTEHVSLLLTANSESVFAFAQTLINKFLSGDTDKVEVIYNQFKNAATQILKNEPLLPIAKAVSNKNVQSDYIFEPSKVAILEDLIPRSLKTQVLRAILDSLASEHGARMVAMDKATENAGELLKALKLAYNQARQAAITREISEIVGGVAALEG
ncbi:MAG: ATP synthase F1 subunit gamma [Bacteroidia bacterium]|nr:ATP synthase F1 subunit gamma [Bacteroidia bacterium]